MVFGKHERGFEPLSRAFAQVLERGKIGGAALCLYQDGRPVFDMWGGKRNSGGAVWEERTPSVSFSTTKGVASTALHMLADRGLVHYDSPVARYWPEFAQQGKQGITVRQVLNHSAGLYDVRSLIEHAEVLFDWDKTAEALARAPAAHEPGRYHGYHAITYGHLVGEIVRRVSGVSFGAFVSRELAEPLGLRDFFIGAPEEAIARAARLLPDPQSPSAGGASHAEENTKKLRSRVKAMRMLQGALRLVGLPMDIDRVRAAFAPRGVERWDFSSPEVLRPCLPSFNGLFSARDLARMYALMAGGGTLDGVRLMSPETVKQAAWLHARGPDGVLVVPMGWRLGYHGIPTTRGNLRGAFGHYGVGGSGAWASPRDNVSFAYVVNTGAPVDLRIIRLSSIAIECARARRKKAA